MRSFSLHSDYFYLLTLSNVGKPSWSWISSNISKLRKWNKISSFLVYVLHKTRNKAFPRRGLAKMGKKYTKKCDARAKLLFCLLNLLFFLKFSLPPASLDLIVHNMDTEGPFKGAVSRNSAKSGNYKMRVQLTET